MNKYIKEYKKEHYKKFSCDMKKEEADEITKLIQEKGITKVEFVRRAFLKLKDNML